MIAEALALRRRPERPARRGRRRRRRRGRRHGGGGDGSPGGPQSAGVLMTGVSYMIPFVAAGGLLIALASCSAATRSSARSTTSSPTTRCPTCRTRARSASTTPSSTRAAGLPRRGALHDRRHGVRLPGPGPGRLHRLRDRRPARHRARLRDGRPGHRAASHPQRRLPRRHRRRRARRRRRALDRRLQGARPGPAA